MSSLKEIADLLKQQNEQDMIQSKALGHIDKDIHDFLEFTKTAREDDKKDAIEEKRERRRLAQLATAAAASAAAAKPTVDQKDQSPSLFSDFLKGLLGLGAAGIAGRAAAAAVTGKAPTRKFGSFDTDGKVKGPGQAARGAAPTSSRLAILDAEIKKAKLKLELERIRNQQAMLDDIQKQVEREAQQRRVRDIANSNKMLRDMSAFDEVERTASNRYAEAPRSPLPPGPTVLSEGPDQPKYKVGDTVKYTQRNGTVVDKIIKRIDPAGRIILSHANGSGAFVADPERLRGGGKPPVKLPVAPTRTTPTTDTPPARPPAIAPRPAAAAPRTPSMPLAGTAPSVSQRSFRPVGGARPAPGGPGRMPLSARGMIASLNQRRRDALLSKAYANPKFGTLLKGLKVLGAAAMAIEVIYIYLIATDQKIVLDTKDPNLFRLEKVSRSQEEKAALLTSALIVLINGTVGAVAATALISTVMGSAAGPWTGIIAGLGGAVAAMKYGPSFPARIIAMQMAGYSWEDTFNDVIGADDPESVANKLGIRVKTKAALTVAEYNLSEADIAQRAAEADVMSQAVMPFTSMGAAGLATGLTAGQIESLGGVGGLAAAQRGLQTAAAESRSQILASRAGPIGPSTRGGRRGRGGVKFNASSYGSTGALAKGLNDDLYNTIMQNNPSLGVSIVDPASMDALAAAIVDALASMPAGGGGGGSRGLQLISAPPPIDLDAIGPQ